MNINIQYIILSALMLTGIFSCNKDLGNYDYSKINAISFTGIDPVYELLAGEEIRIEPKITSTLGDANNQANYLYEWATIPADLSPASYNRLTKNVLSTDRDLSQTVSLAPGEHFLYYTVTDKATGVYTQERFLIKVISDIYEGYLVLSEVGGTSRLDMLSYKSSSDATTFYPDVLQVVGSELKLQGTPYQVYCYPYLSETYGIYIMTSESTDRIHPETFSYALEYNIMYDFMTGINNKVIGRKMFGTQSQIPGVTWLQSDEHVYYAWRGFVQQMFGNPVNAYVGGSTFKTSPHMAVVSNSYDPTAILFNEESKRFVKNLGRTASSVNMNVPSNGTTLFDYNIGMDLVHMEYTYNGFIYAILHDKTSNKHYLARFIESGAQSYWGEIQAQDIDQASHFAVSAESGYLFYSVGSKVYEYDSFLNSSKLMIDKGNAEITLLQFQPFFNRAAANRSETYGKWANWLHVGSYDTGKPADAAGTLEMYSVPLLNADLVKEKSYAGFGKIKSISYRER